MSEDEKCKPSEQEIFLLCLQLLDKEKARLTNMTSEEIVDRWNFVDWRKRKNATIQATDRLNKLFPNGEFVNE